MDLNERMKEYQRLVRELLEATTTTLKVARDAVNMADACRAELHCLLESKITEAEGGTP
ncbi:MAG: hypothetical protein FD149_2723 [Rhodospirillaceae bacterium]|nr:MAG: hypothetical protein FD149_2723 [Rhodospirillaceae bacterium]